MNPALKSARLLVAVLCHCLVSATALASDITKPDLMLANIYQQDADVTRYFVSEKLDGVRALWNGKNLISRSGHIYHAPHWFTENFPSEKLDGELWMGRQQFEALVSAVRTEKPVDAAWKKVKYMVFDLPDMAGPFQRRLRALKRIIRETDTPWLRLVRQERVSSRKALMQKLNRMTKAGAEGLMLHRMDAPYRGKRSNDLLKLKPYMDAEATVIAHLPGKGKYSGLLGALLVETPNGVQFRIGTGFNDRQRKTPPPVGSLITYQYRGLTRKGTPRFASFLRIRERL